MDSKKRTKKAKLTRKQIKNKQNQVLRLLFLSHSYFDVWFVTRLHEVLSVESTIIHPVISCSTEDRAIIDALIDELFTIRALVYNKLGSANFWNESWQSAYNIIKNTFGEGEAFKVLGKSLPSKIYEWTVSDTAKNIIAQQQAAKKEIISRICARFPIIKPKEGEKLTLELVLQNKSNELNRKSAYSRLNSFDQIKEVPWLHRYFREEFVKGHCKQNRQIVYQDNGYSCSRISRYLVKVEVQGISKGKRLSLIVRSNRIIKGQIRLIVNEAGNLEIHQFQHFYNRDYFQLINRQNAIGLDRGYTEVFYTSNSEALGLGFGNELTKKTDRITLNGRKKNKLWALANVKFAFDKEKSSKIIKNNLGNKKELNRRRKDDAYVESVVNSACKIVTKQAENIAVESLVEEISSSKKLSLKARNRLQKWQKGTVADRLSFWATRHATSISWVNAAYTSQVDHRNGTLLGHRDGDCFIGFDEVVLQSDYNASVNILNRSRDSAIGRYMKYTEVRGVLLSRTARFLSSMGLTLMDAIDRGWLDKKYVLCQEFKSLLQGV